LRSLRELMDLRGRTALVTGGAGHIGAVLADGLAELGAAVAILDLEETACGEVAERLAAAHGVRTLAVPADVSDEAALRDGVRRTVSVLGGLQVVVHCAAWVGTHQARGWAVPFAEQSVEAWECAMRVNLTAAFVLAQEAAPALSATAGGSIVLVSSIYGMVAPDLGLYAGTTMANPAAYGVSKAGLLQLTRYLATALAPAVRVNAVSPGGVWRNQPEAFVNRYRARTPLARMATEEDVKGAVAFLAGDLSAYVTGQNVVVDGGWTAW